MTTIYDAYGEDGDFTYLNGGVGAGIIVTGTGPSFRSAYARCSIQVLNAGSVTTIAAEVAARRIWPSGPRSTFWTGCRLWLDSQAAYQTPVLWGLTDVNGVLRLALVSTNGNNFAAGPYAFYKIDAAGNQTLLLTTSSGFSASPAIPDKFDASVSYSTSGSVRLFINGNLVGSYSGDVTTDGLAALAGTYHGTYGTSGSGTRIAAWSELVVSDTDTRNVSVSTSVATGSGTLDQWTGTASNVNALAVNDAIYDTTTTAGAKQLYTQGTIAVGSDTILATVSSIRATQGTGSLAHVALVQSIAGTQYASASAALPAVFGPVQFIQPTNPATGAAWLASDLNASNYQAGYEALA